MPLPTSGTPSRQAIQDAIDEVSDLFGGNRIIAGTASISISGAASGNVAVTFPETFASTPRVLVTNAGGSGSSTFFLLTGSKTAAGFTVTAVNRDNTTTSATIAVEYLAIGPA